MRSKNMETMEGSTEERIVVKLGALRQNPERSRYAVPLDENRIRELIEDGSSPDPAEDVRVRLSPTQTGEFEVASGDHLIEAARRVGVRAMTVTLCNLDDNEMRAALAREEAEVEENRRVSDPLSIEVEPGKVVSILSATEADLTKAEQLDREREEQEGRRDAALEALYDDLRTEAGAA